VVKPTARPMVDPLTMEIAGEEMLRRNALLPPKQWMMNHALMNLELVPEQSLSEALVKRIYLKDDPGVDGENDKTLQNEGFSPCGSLPRALALPKVFWKSQPVRPNKVIIDILKLPSLKSAAVEFGYHTPWAHVASFGSRGAGRKNQGFPERESHGGTIPGFEGEDDDFWC
jgi:hypothetical protein